MSALVKVDSRHYRVIAQEHWGLTDEQMKGMHVHHRIPQSKGGSDDPSNLFVCSPWFHAHVWHNGDEFTLWASAGGAEGAKVTRKKWENGEFKTGFETASFEKQSERGKKGGAACVERGLGIMADGYGEVVSKRMRKMVESGNHHFQTEEHRQRVIAMNKAPQECPICGKVIRGKGPLGVHRKSHRLQ